MSRTKRGNVARVRRKKVLKHNKGYRGALSKLFRPAHQVYLHAMINNYRDRRRKKRDFRSLWIARINGALTYEALSYAVFMGKLKKNNIEINRKMLAHLAYEQPEIFSKVVSEVK